MGSDCTTTNKGGAGLPKKQGGWGADGKKRPKRNNDKHFAGKTWDEMPRVECR